MKRLKLFLITLLILTGSVASRAATEMYAVLNGSTLTFYYDGSKSSRSGTKYTMNSAGYSPKWAKNTTIKTVVFDSSFKNARPKATTGWFWNLSSLTTITGISNLNTSAVTDMQMMFYNCPVSSIDVSGFDTGNVTSMSSMFYGCTNVKSLNVSGFNTSKVTDMKMMFYECTSLTSLNVRNFNTSKVTSMARMFYTCSSLTSLDISNFTLTTSQDTEYMMALSGLKTLTIPATANVIDESACIKVGTASAPCSLVYPSGFTPEKMQTGNGWYRWKDGYFKDGKPSVNLGDANCDGFVDITDAIVIVDYSLGKEPKPFSYVNADMNKDNIVELADAFIIIDYVLGKNTAPANHRFSNNDMMFLSGQGGELELHLRGTGSFKGAEMTLNLPEGCTLCKSELNPARSDGHELLVNDLGNGCYRLVVMGFKGETFSNNGTALIRLSVDGNHGNDVRVSDILLASANQQTIAIAGVEGVTTGIGNAVINGDASVGEWYNLQGQRVASPNRGIYIRNGKKFSVK